MMAKIMYVTFKDKTTDSIVTLHGVVGENQSPGDVLHQLIVDYGMNQGGSQEEITLRMAGQDYEILQIGDVEAKGYRLMAVKDDETNDLRHQIREQLKNLEIEDIQRYVSKFMMTPMDYGYYSDSAVAQKYHGKTPIEVLRELGKEIPSYFNFEFGSECNDFDYDTIVAAVVFCDIDKDELGCYNDYKVFAHPEYGCPCTLHECFRVILEYWVGVRTLQFYDLECEYIPIEIPMEAKLGIDV